jgi:thiamine kinase-like enzyme
MQTGSEASAQVAAVARELGVGAIRSVEPIKHGLTNRSWIVTTEADRLVVRISNQSIADLQIDRNSEAVVLQRVAQAGIGAEILRCDPERGVLVTRYLGATWTGLDAQLPENIDRIAALLRQLHALDAPGSVRVVDLAATLHGYLRTLAERGIRSSLTSQPLRECADETALQLREGSESCLSHNDVHHLNIVNDGAGLRLIDWEYAGIGEPLFDLASLCVYHRYRRSQRERLLSAYAAPSAAVSWQRLELACWLFDYIRDLWLEVTSAAATASD